MRGVLESGLGLAVHVTFPIYRSKSSRAIKLMMVLSTFSFVLLVLTLYIIRIDNDGELNETIFLLVRNTLFMNLSTNDVPRRTRTTNFLMIPNMTCMWLSPTWRCNKIIPIILALLFVALLNLVLSQMRIKDSYSCLLRFSCRY